MSRIFAQWNAAWPKGIVAALSESHSSKGTSPALTGSLLYQKQK
jgi:hypothetical protein